jgi:heterodisulfide reductase subunit C2
MIESAELDPNFKHEIAHEPGGEHIRRCFACSTCTLSCPVRAVSDRFAPHRIIRMALLGLREEVLSSDTIWLCSTCFTCHERCPQDVRITELFDALRNIAVRAGHVSPALRASVDLVRDHGRLIAIGEFDNERRVELGLPAIEERPKELAGILQATGLGALGNPPAAAEGGQAK